MNRCARCARCGHLRKPEDHGPEWACPACGVAYVKGEQAARQRLDAAATPISDGGGIPIRALLVVAAGMVLAIGGHRWYQSTQPSRMLSPAVTSPAAQGKVQVVMYATERCPYCAQAREFFAEKGIAYLEKDVQNDLAARQEFAERGGRGVPLIVVGDQQISGFSAAAFSQFYSEVTGKAL